MTPTERLILIGLFLIDMSIVTPNLLTLQHDNKLCALALGRPSYSGTFMRLDFIEKAPTNCPFSSDMVPISILAYETYAKRIGAKQFRIIDPINDKVLRSYLQHGGFTHHLGQKGNPHYLVREL